MGTYGKGDSIFWAWNCSDTDAFVVSCEFYDKWWYIYLSDFTKKKYNLLCEIPGLKVCMPEGAFYFFPDVSSYYGKSFNGKKIENSTDMAFYLLNEANVATVMGSAFGDDDCIRLSYATSEELLREALRRMKEAFTALK